MFGPVRLSLSVMADNNRHRIFVGTYTKGKSRGIYSAWLDRRTGALGAAVVAAEAPNPTFLALSPDRRFLYAVCANAGWASSFRVGPDGTVLAAVHQAPAGPGPTPCHISVDATGTIALAANYHLGLAAAIPLAADGTMGTPRVVTHSGKGPHPSRQTQSHVHSAYFTPDGRFAIVCDLGLDRVFTYRIDGESAHRTRRGKPALRRLRARHRPAAFRLREETAPTPYVISELDSTN